MLLQIVVLSLAVGGLALAGGRASAPEEPWSHVLVCLVPLSVIVGTVLTVVASAA
jgi:hypothetical protein